MIAGFCQQLVFGEGDLGAMLDGLETFLDESGVPADVRAHLLLAADELGANVASHAYDGGEEPGWLTLEAVCGDGTVTLRFVDGGRPFDPLSLAPPDKAASLEDRPIGGLGILLVRRLMDQVEYQRVEETNRVSLVKRWAA